MQLWKPSHTNLAVHMWPRWNSFISHQWLSVNCETVSTCDKCWDKNLKRVTLLKLFCKYRLLKKSKSTVTSQNLLFFLPQNLSFAPLLFKNRKHSKPSPKLLWASSVSNSHTYLAFILWKDIFTRLPFHWVCGRSLKRLGVEREKCVLGMLDMSVFTTTSALPPISTFLKKSRN